MRSYSYHLEKTICGCACDRCSEGEGEVEEATPDPDTILPAAPPAAGHFVIGVCIIHKQDQEGGLLSHQSTLFLFSYAYAYVLKMSPEAKAKAH